MADISQFTKNGFDVDGFIEAILKQIGLDSVEAGLKERLFEEIGKRVEFRIMNVVMSSISPEQVREFEQLIKQNPEAEPIEVLLDLAQKDSDLPERLNDALAKLFDEIVKDADEVTKLHKKLSEDEK